MKKSYLYLLVAVGTILISCGGGDDSDTIPIDENTAPTVPNQIFPLGNEICTDNNVIFQWAASTDAESNSISYRIEVSENSSFSPIRYNESSFSESKLISLEKGKAYYWRIKAVDSRNLESNYSESLQFITEGEGVSNHVPFAPTLVAPALEAEVDGTSTVLSWTASDIDGDALLFDVYLDTNENPITKITEDQAETTFNVTGLSPLTKYYFKVAVKDDKGATSVGQVWNFTTK